MANSNSRNNSISVTFAGLTGSISFGLYCSVFKTFNFEKYGKFNEFLNEIDVFLSKELDKIVDFGPFSDSLTGSFGIGGTIESICMSLCHFPFPETTTTTTTENPPSKRHLILLPNSFGTEVLPPFRTCTDEQYASASLPELLSILRTRRISFSLVGPGLSDSTVVEQFLVFKCNEKIGSSSKLAESLGIDWVVRLSANLTGDEPPSPKIINTVQPPVDDSELLNQTLLKVSLLPPDERVLALKTLLDPATSTFSSSFRQKFASAVKSRLQQDISLIGPVISNPNSNSTASEDSSATFWSGCVRFLEKQQSFMFRAQFISVDSQSVLPQASLDNWPPELSLTGLLDSKKESIQAGLSVGYAFKVNVAKADSTISSYLMTRMCQNNQSPSHLACFRISQDVLIMLRVLDDLQFIGYLIDRRFPKNNLTPAAQAASNAINSLTSVSAKQQPISTTLSTGIEGMTLLHGRRPSFDVNSSTFQLQLQKQKTTPPPSKPKVQSNTNNSNTTVKSNSGTSYVSYPQFMQQQQQQQSPVKIAAISSTTVTTNQLLTDPQAILQKLRPVIQRNHASPPLNSAGPAPSLQPNEQSCGPADDDPGLDQSFVDAWLN